MAGLASAQDAIPQPIEGKKGATDTGPRNLGAVVRSAAAFDAHGVVVPQRRAVGMTASAWRTSPSAVSFGSTAYVSG